MREMRAAMNPMLGMAAAGGLSMSFMKAIGDSSHLAHELQMLRNAGRTSQEVAQAMLSANRTMRALPTTTLVDNLAVLRETTGAFGNFQHARENLLFNQRIGSMMQNALGDKAGTPGDMFNNIVRGMEMRGAAQDHKRYQREVGELYKAMVFTGGRVNPEEFFNFAQQSNPYIKGFSARYLTRIAPSLIQEYGGDKAGTMQSTWAGTILGKAKNKLQTEAWMKLGLLDPKQVVYNKVGPVGWHPGAIKGTNLALTDPLKWSETVLMPALAAHGMKTGDQLSLAKALMPLFRDRNANRLANTLVYGPDRARLHKDEGLINRVPGAEKAYQDTLRKDPLMAWQAMKSSFTNLASVLFGTGKGESPVAVALVNIAKGVNWLAETIERHPWLGHGLGTLLGGAAALATLKMFGIGLRWAFSPIRLLLSPLAKIGGLMWRAFGPMAFRGILAIGTRLAPAIRALGPLLLRGLAALAPIVMEGIGAAFALLSNPVGWAVLAGVAIVAAGTLIWHFRKQIGGFLSRSWGWIKSTFLAVPWGSIGMAIADALTLGLASKLPAIGGAIKGWWSRTAPTWAGGASAPVAKGPARAAHVYRPMSGNVVPFPPIAGHRRKGGGVDAGKRYVVGEEGEEEFVPDRPGTIVPHSELQRRRSERAAAPITVHIHGATDPHAVAREVERVLRKHANGQAALLSD
jgi:hypothetical protein